MTREELLAAVTAERFGPPVRTDRRRCDPDIQVILEELRETPTSIRIFLDVQCDYAACEYTAERWIDGYAFCAGHLRKHRSEVVA